MLKRTAKSIHAHYALLAFGLVVLSLVVLLRQGDRLNAVEPVPCPTSINVIDPAPGMTIAGVYNLRAYNGMNSFNPATSVKFLIDNTIIGNGTAESTSPNIYYMSWNTTFLPNGPHTASAEFTLATPLTTESGSNVCRTAVIPFAINNTNTSSSFNITVQAVPSSWVGPTNVPFAFDAFAYITNSAGEVIDITNSASFSWKTNIGTINPAGSHVDFFSGPITGGGEVEVMASYSGKTDVYKIDIEVTNQTDSNYPSTNNSGSSNTSDQEEDDATEAIINLLNLGEPYTVNLSESSQGDSAMVRCFKVRLLAAEFEDLAEGSRLNTEQFRQVRSCFADRRYIVPVNLAPIEPSGVENLPIKTEKIRLENPVNVVGVDKSEKLLKFSGVADPDSEILIYVFSEPLVMTAQADSNGQWSYVLEDPLAPGEHTAYAIVQQEGDYVRSEGVAFALEPAVATDKNPNGFSLALASSDTATASSSINYIVAAVALVLFVSVVLARFVWFKKKTLPSSSLESQTPGAVQPSIEPSSNKSDQTPQGTEPTNSA